MDFVAATGIAGHLERSEGRVRCGLSADVARRADDVVAHDVPQVPRHEGLGGGSAGLGSIHSPSMQVPISWHRTERGRDRALRVADVIEAVLVAREYAHVP